MSNFDRQPTRGARIIRRNRVAPKTGDTDTPSSRRVFIKTSGTFIAGIASGVLGSYGTSYLSVIASPQELADTQSSNAPVRTVVVPEREQDLQGELWVYPGKISENERALSAISGTALTFDDLHDRLYNAGYIDVYNTVMTLLVEGRRNSPVRVIGMHAEVVRRDLPPEGVSIIGPEPEGDTGSSVSLAFNLDERHPVARELIDPTNGLGRDNIGGHFFAKSNTQLARGEQEVYHIWAFTDWDVEWNLNITVAAAGEPESKEVIVGRMGNPFRTTGTLRTPADDRFIDFSRYSEVYQYSSPDTEGYGSPRITFVRAKSF